MAEKPKRKRRRGGLPWIPAFAIFVLIVGWSVGIVLSRGMIPIWSGLVILFAVPGFIAAWWARHRLLRDSSEEGACVRCGYDLRGQRVPRCPECGALTGFEKSADELGLDQRELKL